MRLLPPFHRTAHQEALAALEAAQEAAAEAAAEKQQLCVELVKVREGLNEAYEDIDQQDEEVESLAAQLKARTFLAISLQR